MSAFAHTLIDWQRHHGRHDLPWSATREPYRVWLSEIMLQQTQVITVIPYFERFIARFPDVAALAAAPIEEVMPLWAGLGYYARARNLHRAAIMVMARFGGQFPQTARELAELPGVGRSTAAAIAAFCFGERAAILDGNVKRVLTRAFGIEGFPGEKAIENQLWGLAESLLPAQSIDTYTQALMDLGATLCTRAKPRCADCPVANACIALQTGRTGTLPTARPRKAAPKRAMHYLVLLHDDTVLLEQRAPAGIWGGLKCLPEWDGSASLSVRVESLGLALEAYEALAPFTHAFTHFELELRPVLCRVSPLERSTLLPTAWYPLESIGACALPAPIRKLLLNLESGFAPSRVAAGIYRG
ncbi:MAG: A/G-specific adenine glycosylase [Pseudomonadota bacterium]|jgi:A/G-specific adenine glycosylase